MGRRPYCQLEQARLDRRAGAGRGQARADRRREAGRTADRRFDLVNLFKLLAAAVRARPGRKTIVTRQRNFPTDLYVAQGLAEMLGLELNAVPADEIAAIDR